jgi:hypothetical protein
MQLIDDMQEIVVHHVLRTREYSPANNNPGERISHIRDLDHLRFHFFAEQIHFHESTQT